MSYNLSCFENKYFIVNNCLKYLQGFYKLKNYIIYSIFLLLIFILIIKDASAQTKSLKNGNLFKLGNCTYSMDGNISSFADAVVNQKIGKYQEAIEKYKRSLNNVYKCNFKSYNNYAICASMINNYRQSDSLFRESIKVGKSCDSCFYDEAMTNYNRVINKISEDDNIFAFLLSKKVKAEYIKAHPLPIGYIYLANYKAREAILYFSLGEKSLQTSNKQSIKTESTLQYNLALAHYQLGDFENSQKCLTKSIGTGNLNYMDWTLKGILAFENADRNAELSFKNAFADRITQSTTVNLPKYFLLSGQFEKSTTEFLKIFQDTKEKSDTACFGLAVSTMLEKKYAESQDYFNKLYKIKSGHLDSDHLLAKATMFLNSDKYNEAESLFKEIMSLDDKNKNYALIGLACLDYYKEKYSEAINKFEKAEKENGLMVYSYCTATIRNMCYENLHVPFTPINVDNNFSKDIDKGYYVMRLLGKGYSLCFNNNSKDAYALILEAYNITNNEPQVLLLKGYIEFELNKFDDAINTLDILIKMNPKIIDAYKIKALALTGKHSYTNALKTLDIALEIDPKKQDQVYNIIGMTYTWWSNDGNTPQNRRDSLGRAAISFYERAFALNPSLGYRFNVATQFSELKDTVNANKNFSLLQKWSWVWNNIAIMKFNLGDLQGAELDIQKALNFEKFFPTSAKYNIEQNKTYISNQAGRLLTTIFCYNIFPEYKVKPIEITRPFVLDSPPLKKFDPEFEMFDTF